MVKLGSSQDGNKNYKDINKLGGHKMDRFQGESNFLQILG
jgi:hypothetical protein